MNRIKTMKELEAAQSRVRRDLAIKKNSMARRFDDAKEFYTPANMVSNAIGNIAPMLDIRSLLLSIIRDLKNRL